MSSSGGRKGDDYVDPEQQFILRLPDDIAEKLSADLRLSTSGGKNDKLAISMDGEGGRTAKVKYDGVEMQAELLDLPCIVESLKSTDNKSFYKTADISQIMIATKTGSEGNPDEASQPRKKSHKLNRQYQYPHGLTPPLKNVRKSRFRRILRKKYIESPDVENEVKTLLKSDLTAVSLPRYELVGGDDTRSSGRAELNKVFEEVSSEDDPDSPSDAAGGPGTEGGSAGTTEKSPPPVNEQVKNIMREISVIQSRRDQIRQTLERGAALGSERLDLLQELELLRSKESTKLVYLDELRTNSLAPS